MTITKKLLDRIIQNRDDSIRPTHDLQLALDRRLAQKLASHSLLTKDDITPETLGADILTFSVIWDLVEAPDARHFKYRLFGTSLCEAVGFEMTGKYLEENPFDVCRMYVTRLLDIVSSSGLSCFSSARLQFPNRFFSTCEMTFHPLWRLDRICLIYGLMTFGGPTGTSQEQATAPIACEDRYRLFHRHGLLSRE